MVIYLHNSPYKEYINQTIPMLENLVEYNKVGKQKRRSKMTSLTFFCSPDN